MQVEPINDAYCYIIESNPENNDERSPAQSDADQIRIIHSINDDMYQVESIIKSCRSNKNIRDWLNDQTTNEMMAEMSLHCPYTSNREIYEKRRNLGDVLNGFYVNRALVNYVAIWASSWHSVHIFRVLDWYSEVRCMHRLRKQLIPEHHKNKYFILLWRDLNFTEPGLIKLHMICRNKNSFAQVKSHYDNQDELWYYRDNLPASTVFTNDIRNMIKKDFANITIVNNTIYTNDDDAVNLCCRIEEYFDKLYLDELDNGY